ncbi:Hypothetical protein PHPALM_13789 [Phytophthora palmivora]|uniref:PiggyBac transposable element-derived protein domain-containing protein n=1 Tax=Phytophthora palmivora TaxID=4796 RepID=A0A2P4XWF0_9STRA|nr:Hypothetical protein PHPALM_13789 [Phytophthora palmivora]
MFLLDECALRSTSNRKTILKFMLDKLLRYGSKIVPLVTRGLLIIRVFYHVCDGCVTSFDDKADAAGVFKNLNSKIVLYSDARHKRHAFVIDSFYSSTILAFELLGMSGFVIGTVVVNLVRLTNHQKKAQVSFVELYPVLFI